MTHSPSYRRILHKLGYYDYQQGLIFRHLKQGKGWLDHEDHCRSFIIRALDETRPKKITVLGSGWLLELPLKEMSESAESISLVDIIHPPEVISQTSGFKNVHLVEADVTGGLILETWNKAGKRTFLKKLTSLSEIEIPLYDPEKDPGLIISLNILTQLEALPERFLRKRSKVPEEEFLNFRKEVQRRHLTLLMKYNSLLITDTAEIFTRQNGESYQTDTLLAELPEGQYREEWIWDFDLAGADFKTRRSVMKVTAIII